MACCVLFMDKVENIKFCIATEPVLVYHSVPIYWIKVECMLKHKYVQFRLLQKLHSETLFLYMFVYILFNPTDTFQCSAKGIAYIIRQHFRFCMCSCLKVVCLKLQQIADCVWLLVQSPFNVLTKL